MIEWLTDRHQKYFIRSKCGRWQVSKAFIGDDPKYSLWDLHKRDEPAEIFGTLSEAKNRAEAK